MEQAGKSRLEQQLVTDMLRALKNQAMRRHVSFDYFQIESGATAIGIPDLFIMLGGKGLWVECKRFHSDWNLEKGVKSSRTVKFEGSVLFRPGQARMMTKLHQHGENVALCAISEYGDVWVHKWGSDEHDYNAENARYHIYHKDAVYQTHVLDAFCTALRVDIPLLSEIDD